MSEDNTRDDDGINGKTMFVASRSYINTRISFESFFLKHYDFIRERVNHADHRSFMIFAGTEISFRPEYKCVEVTDNTTSDVTIGRHENCDYCLLEDPQMSLRHLLLRARIMKDNTPLVKVLDLNTPGGFDDETGKPVHGLTSDINLFFHVGKYAFLIFYAEPGMNWGDNAAKTWNSLPEHRLLDFTALDKAGRPQEIPVRPRLKIVTDDHREISCITRITGPSYVSRLDPADPRTLGFLMVRSGMVDVSIPLSASVLGNGILIGRYERCELGLHKLPFTNHVSRVHALLLHDEFGLWCIDLASTNGTYVNDKSEKSVIIKSNVSIEISEDVVLRWKFA